MRLLPILIFVLLISTHLVSTRLAPICQPYCIVCSGQVVSDEAHVITKCPHLNTTFLQHASPFGVLFRLRDFKSFDSLCTLDRLRAMPGMPPQGMLAKQLSLLATEDPPRCGCFVYDLYSHISANAPSLTTCPSSDSETISDREEDKLASSLEE